MLSGVRYSLDYDAGTWWFASRSEIRDVVDLYCLEQAGYRVEDHVDDALRKDAGATPATIAWLLSTLRVPERLPGAYPGGSRQNQRDFDRFVRARRFVVRPRRG